MRGALVQLLAGNGVLVICLFLTSTNTHIEYLGGMCQLHTHTESLGGMHPLAGAGAQVHRPDVKNMLPGGRLVFPPTVQLAK